MVKKSSQIEDAYSSGDVEIRITFLDKDKRVMPKEILQMICKYFEVKTMQELIEQEYNQITESKMDGFCSLCGKYHGQVEAETKDEKCNSCHEQSVISLAQIVFNFNI